MRLFLLLAAVAAPAPPNPPELDKFEAALDARQYEAAAAIVDKLIAARTPIDGRPRPDSLLNALLGRVTLSADQAAPAATLLSHARLDELPVEQRTPTALALGQALEFRGDRLAALAAYRDAAAAAVDSPSQRAALLGAARQTLVANPSATLQHVAALADGPPAPDRWQARYLASLASSLAGDAATAQRFADGAWADAATAPARSLAPLHVGTLRAGLAAARRDTESEKAMLAATNGLAVHASGNLTSRLPVCGDDGVTSSDFVTFGIVTGTYGIRRLVPIAASRVGVVAAFYDRLDGSALIQTSPDRPLFGTVVTVSCRTSASSNSGGQDAMDDSMLSWFVEHGIYPASASNDPSNAHSNAIQSRIDELQARFGADSPLLIEPKWQMLAILEARAKAGEPVLPGQLSDLRNEVAAGMKRAGAPAWLYEPIAARTAYDREMVAAAGDPTAQIAVFERFLTVQLNNTPFALARELLIGAIDRAPSDLPVQLARMVIELDKRAPRSLPLRERQAWALIVARAQLAMGAVVGRRAALDSARFAPDLCAVSDGSDPDLLAQQFTSEDYPGDLIAGAYEGSSMLDFGVAVDGKVRSPRIIASVPAGLFDQLSMKGTASLRFTPAQRGGRPYACRGQVQSVIWKLEGIPEFTVPVPTPTPMDSRDVS